jgi:GTP cyclohydrolase I
MKTNKPETLNNLASLYSKIITAIGEDVNREGLQHTPARAAKAFRYLTHGYDLTLEEIVRQALFSSDSKEMVMVKDIELFSTCEHHLLPILGKCHVGYIPNGKILGLSKIARIVDMFAHRLQVQENLNQQIAAAIAKVTNAAGVGVIIEASHLCIMARGVEKQHATMKTSTMLGCFKTDPAIRNEFLSLIN